MNPPEQYVICWGNPADGFEYIGAFNSAEDANEYADDYMGGKDWWVIMLQSPAFDEESD